MEWPTILVSALVSALVSMVAVSQVTVMQRRAERREAAREKVAELVAPLLNELARYLYLCPPEAKRTPEHSHMEDHGVLVVIRSASSALQPWRRRLLDRRLRRIFGDYWTNLARDFPTVRIDDSGFSAWFAASVRNHLESPGSGPADGLMHRAYCKLPGHPLQDQLRRELRRLASAR